MGRAEATCPVPPGPSAPPPCYWGQQPPRRQRRWRHVVGEASRGRRTRGALADSPPRLWQWHPHCPLLGAGRSVRPVAAPNPQVALRAGGHPCHPESRHPASAIARIHLRQLTRLGAAGGEGGQACACQWRGRVGVCVVEVGCGWWGMGRGRGWRRAGAKEGVSRHPPPYVCFDRKKSQHSRRHPRRHRPEALHPKPDHRATSRPSQRTRPPSRLSSHTFALPLPLSPPPHPLRRLTPHHPTGVPSPSAASRLAAAPCPRPPLGAPRSAQPSHG